MHHTKPQLVQRRSVSEDFERETKMVVLNFMGLIPASCPATSEVRDTARVDVTSDDDAEHVRKAHNALLHVPHDLEPVPEYPCTGNHCTGYQGVERYPDESPADSEEETRKTDADILPESHQSDMLQSAGGLLMESSMQLASDSQHLAILVPSDEQAAHSSHLLPQQPDLLQVPVHPGALSRTPSPSAASSRLLFERQSSSRSTTSSRSRSSITRNANLNVQLADLESLVRAHALPPLVIPLRDGISRELHALEQPDDHIEDATEGTAVSPETEVADMLRTLGDRVNDEVGDILAQAVNAVVPPQANDQELSYGTLRVVAEGLMNHVHPGWSQVALILLFSQRVAWSMLTQGRSSIGRLADHTTRFIEDHVADFIISNGGWQSILDMEVSELMAEAVIDAETDEVDDAVTDDNGEQAISQQDAQCYSASSQQSALLEHDWPLRSATADSSCQLANCSTSEVERPTSNDHDVCMYMAVFAIVAVMASTIYGQLTK